MERAAVEYLQNDRLLHIDMLEPLRLKEARVLYAGEDGVLVYHIPGGVHMLSAVSEDSAKRISGLMEDVSLLVLHQPYLREELKDRFSLTGVMPCHQAAYFSEAPVVLPPMDAQVRLLSEADLPIVLLHYTNIPDESYIRQRLQAGMLGAYVDGNLAGFVGTHPEGTIGLLEVLPAYPRRGLGLALEAAMMQRQQSLGYIPYSQVKQGNAASIALQKKLGMEVTEEASLCWVY